MFIKANSTRMKFPGQGHTTGLIKKHTEVSGLKIRCMDKEYCSGLMASYTTDNSKMINAKALENSHGKMAVFMMENGKKENKMEKEFLLTNWVKQDTEFGKTERILSG